VYDGANRQAKNKLRLASSNLLAAKRLGIRNFCQLKNVAECQKPPLETWKETPLG
jgi:hypothetical protein